jgi:hypothetical protein
VVVARYRDLAIADPHAAAAYQKLCFRHLKKDGEN